MAPKDLKQIFPIWYKEWLFLSLGINDGEEISRKYLEPLFQLNKNWLEENYKQENYSWDKFDVATSYTLYYMTINIPKLWMVLSNSGVWRERELRGADSLVEFGCGPGTFLWSYLFYLQATAPEQLQKIKKIRGIDTSSTYLKIAKKLFNSLKTQEAYSHIEAEFVCGKWEDHQNDVGYPLYIFGNSLVESSMDLSSLPKQCDTLLIIEPGTLRHFQKLRIMRDVLISKGWHVHFPCSVGDNCPMIENNWCHFHINRFLLPFVQKMSSAAKRHNHRHNFSAFLFSRKENQLDKDCWRVLSPPRKVKRTVMRYICNGNHMFEAILGRKIRNNFNKDFIDMELGSMGRSTSRFQNKRFNENDTFLGLKKGK